MATIRNINEYLASGEAKNIVGTNVVVSGNVGYVAAQAEEYDGMFQRVKNGITTLYRVPDQDIHWSDINETEVDLTETPTELLSFVLTGEEILSTDSATFSVTGKVTNTENKANSMSIIVKNDGVQVGSVETVDLMKDEVAKLFAVSGDILTDVAVDSVIAIEFYSNKDNKVMLNGDSLRTEVEFIKPQSAPVVMSAAVLESFDWNLLPTTPGQAGTLYIHQANSTLRVSQG